MRWVLERGVGGKTQSREGHATPTPVRRQAAKRALPGLEFLRRCGELARLLEKADRTIVDNNQLEEFGDRSEVDLRGMNAGTDCEPFPAKALVAARARASGHPAETVPPQTTHLLRTWAPTSRS
jgi:hypothetical protein